MLPTVDVENFLARGLELMGLELENQAEVLARLSLYFQELKKWNKKVNLVARTLDDEQILENHFLDSLTLLFILAPLIRMRETVLDIGTGAGFPGLVLKAACPQLGVTLIEPRKNRFYFLKHIVRTLNLQEVKVHDVHLEEGIGVRELAARKFSCITSRAFTDMSRFVKLASPYLAGDGRIVMMKGPGAAAELEELATNGLPGQFYVAETRKIRLPYSRAERWLVSIMGPGAKPQ